jgi:hypothetical protein
MAGFKPGHPAIDKPFRYKVIRRIAASRAGKIIVLFNTGGL